MKSEHADLRALPVLRLVGGTSGPRGSDCVVIIIPGVWNKSNCAYTSCSAIPRGSEGQNRLSQSQPQTAAESMKAVFQQKHVTLRSPPLGGNTYLAYSEFKSRLHLWKVRKVAVDSHQVSSKALNSGAQVSATHATQSEFHRGKGVGLQTNSSLEKCL